MKITSPVFENNQSIPAKYTCDGENIHPPIAFHDVPEATRSLVLLLEDPDAPKGTFTHWVLYNIPPEQREIIEDALPDIAEEGLNSLGKKGYVGPCPPSGTHHYVFTLYALDIPLAIDGDPDVEIIKRYMKGHNIKEAKLIGLYQKK